MVWASGSMACFSMLSGHDYGILEQLTHDRLLASRGCEPVYDPVGGLSHGLRQLERG